VSASSSAKRGQFWRADWFVAVLIVMTVVILHQAMDLIGTLERRFYDFASTSSGRQPSERIAVIAIDDQSIANIGHRPVAEAPSYDATHHGADADTDIFEKTAVIRPGAPGSPAPGKTDVGA
jgi:CHASE2 domain-containing sensor protein